MNCNRCLKHLCLSSNWMILLYLHNLNPTTKTIWRYDQDYLDRKLCIFLHKSHQLAQILTSQLWVINRHHGVTWLIRHRESAEIPEECSPFLELYVDQDATQHCSIKTDTTLTRKNHQQSPSIFSFSTVLLLAKENKLGVVKYRYKEFKYTLLLSGSAPLQYLRIFQKSNCF